MRYCRPTTLACALVTFSLLGCGREDPNLEGRPQTVPAGGTVTQGGQPVEGATVTFVPNVPFVPGQTSSAKSSVGETDAEGKFQLTTFEAGDGAVPGEYKVTVVKREPLPPSARIDQDDPNYDPNAPEPPEPKHLLPEQYSKPATTPLTETVAESGENQFTIELSN